MVVVVRVAVCIPRYLGDDIRYDPKTSNMPSTALDGWQPTKDLSTGNGVTEMVHNSLQRGDKMNATELSRMMWPKAWPRAVGGGGAAGVGGGGGVLTSGRARL